jgi:cell division protein FtsI/penicillin-binding protein 2
MRVKWNHSIFVAFAPMENQNTIAVMIENGGFGSALLDLLPVLIEKYLRQKTRVDLEKRVLAFYKAVMPN